MRKSEEYYNKKSNLYLLDLNKDTPHYKILNFINSLKGSLIILDIGCATGYLGKELKKRGHQVYGVEISEKAGKEAEKVLNGVIIGDIEEIDLPFPENYFDIIICADVLEHLFNPKEVLIKLKKYLKNDGYLIASIPNIANWKIRLELLKGKFEYKNIGLLDFGHIRFFTYYTAKKMFEETGYKIEYIDFNINLNDFPSVFKWVIRAILKNKSTMQIWKKITRKFINFFGYQIIFVVSKKEGVKCLEK